MNPVGRLGCHACAEPRQHEAVLQGGSFRRQATLRAPADTAAMKARDPGYGPFMTEDRRTKQSVTPGEDPREIDRERASAEALEDLAAQEGLTHERRRSGETGTTADAKGADLPDLDDAPDVPHLRDQA
jgi:topoisomerase IA-like protein